MTANLENRAVATGLEKVNFHYNPKEGQCQRMFKCWTIALISHANKVMFKILQARLQQYTDQELPDVQAGFRKNRGTRGQIANVLLDHGESKGIPEKYLFHFTDCAKDFDCVDHNKLWKILKEMGIPDHLTCLLRNL